MYDNDPQVVYAALKHVWASGNRESAFSQMKAFTENLVAYMGLSFFGDVSKDVRNNSDYSGLLKLLARCYLKFGDWQTSLEEDWNDQVIPQVLKSYHAATQCDSEWYRAWHSWAFANFVRLSLHFRKC